jgi:hypothetical protein
LHGAVQGGCALGFAGLAGLGDGAPRARLKTLYPGEFEARLFVIAGDYDRALSRLEQGEWGPQLTIPWLCADHFWDRCEATRASGGA